MSLYLGCTAATHRILGIHAVVNARSGRQDLNDVWHYGKTDQEGKDMYYDAYWLRGNIVVRQWNSKWFRRRFTHKLFTED